jgi:hypothetical protein
MVRFMQIAWFAMLIQASTKNSLLAPVIPGWAMSLRNSPQDLAKCGKK